MFSSIIKFEFFQNLSSYLISFISPAVIHNLEKYIALKKVSYLSSIEDIEGDYLEFGVFTGSSFCHFIRCSKKHQYLTKNKKIKFYGFDSFEGFGKLNENEFHPFYNDENFKTSFKRVEKRVRKIASTDEAKLVKGFFNETLKLNPDKYNIKKAKVIFIDSDTYSSAKLALDFCKNIIQPGTYLIIDDYFSYKGSENKGVAKAFNEFLDIIHFNYRSILSYGNGGKVFILSDKKS